MEIKLNVSTKTLKKACALLDMDIPSEKQLQDKLKDVVIDLSDAADEDTQTAELALCALAIGVAFE